MPKEEVVIEAKSVEDAIKEGLKRLGKDENQAEIEILQDVRPGLFDRDEQLARVRLTADGVDLKNLMRRVLSNILQLMGIKNFSIEIDIDKEFYRAEISAPEELQFIIGKHGETLNAIEHLLTQILRRRCDDPVIVILDADGYRKRRRNTLEEMAHSTCTQAINENTEIQLEPMPPYERKIVHEAVSEIDGVKSNSIGEDANRRVVIKPKEQA